MLANESITSLESVLDLAVWLEKHGQDFYEKAAEAAIAPELKELFLILAAEERKHCAIYTDLYQLYTGKSADEDALLGEYGEFIHLLIKEISQPLDYDDALTEKELIDKALQFEKNTLLYFFEVKQLFRGKAGTLIEAVCREERRHIKKLLEVQDLVRESVQVNVK